DGARAVVFPSVRRHLAIPPAGRWPNADDLSLLLHRAWVMAGPAHRADHRMVFPARCTGPTARPQDWRGGARLAGATGTKQGPGAMHRRAALATETSRTGRRHAAPWPPGRVFPTAPAGPHTLRRAQHRSATASAPTRAPAAAHDPGPRQAAPGAGARPP